MKRIAFALALTAIVGSSGAQNLTIDPNMARKVQAAEFFISHFYVDSLSEERVVEDAIAGMLKPLDPHSTYIPAKDVERSNEHITGSFEGVGVQFNMVDDTLVVVQPVSGGPSERVGILAGDRFVSVDDTAIAGVGMTSNEIMRRLRGPKGSQVRIGVVRDGVEGVNEFVVERDKIPVTTLDAAYLIDDTTAYVRLSSFGMTTLSEFLTALDGLNADIRTLVLDLQGNGGGLLEAANQISNEFLPEGALIVYTDGRSTGRRDYNARGDGRLQGVHTIVLVDSYTASAAEIVAAALQDNHRATIVGRRTFGKGLVQRPFELPDRSVIRLTVSHYYTPSGRCIQKPYRPDGRQEYSKDIAGRLASGELTDSLPHLAPDSLGGILPDIYVPLDTTKQTPLYRQLSAKSCILNTSLKYTNKHRKELLNDYPDTHTYIERFEPGQDVIDLLLSEARAKNISYTDEELAATLPLAQNVLKGLIARDLWDLSAYYQIVNDNNDIYARALRP